MVEVIDRYEVGLYSAIEAFPPKILNGFSLERLTISRQPFSAMLEAILTLRFTWTRRLTAMYA